MKRIQLPILVIALAVIVMPLSVGAISSTSYEILPEEGTTSQAADGYANTSDMLESTSYQMQGSTEAFSGSLTSSSYTNESGGVFQYYCGDNFLDPGETCDGVSLGGATCASQGFDSGSLTCSSACAYVTSACVTASAGGGGGGGGGGSSSPDDPTIHDDIADLEFTYESSFLLYGGNDSGVDEIEVDGDDSDSEVDGTSWTATVALSFGLNSFELVAIDGSRDSDETVYEIYRRLVGDVNEDDTVDDYDLSKLVGLWGDDAREGDFNDDGSVDDYDFSMMVARWGTSV
ncbi:hypothetical protein HOI18_04795 [Candidatus Uhrbacteria bacterium]|jgi:hypothetical protein|nr:hypothetical protein [Candidatus Uhrbacteria bacterium]